MNSDQDDEMARSTDPERLLLTPEEAAAALHVGRTTMYALIKARRVHAIHIGRSCRVSRAEIQRFVASLDAPRQVVPISSRRPRRTSANQSELFNVDPTPPEAA